MVFVAVSFILSGNTNAQVTQPKIHAFLGTHYDKTEKRTSFQPNETVNVFVEFEIPVNEKSELIIHWINPSGNLERYHTQDVLPTNRVDIVYFSWLKLHKKGIMTRSFTGQDYDIQYGGKWKAVIYLNSDVVGQLQFEMAGM